MLVYSLLRKGSCAAPLQLLRAVPAQAAGMQPYMIHRYAVQVTAVLQLLGGQAEAQPEQRDGEQAAGTSSPAAASKPENGQDHSSDGSQGPGLMELMGQQQAALLEAERGFLTDELALLQARSACCRAHL